MVLGKFLKSFENLIPNVNSRNSDEAVEQVLDDGRFLRGYRNAAERSKIRVFLRIGIRKVQSQERTVAEGTRSESWA